MTTTPVNRLRGAVATWVLVLFAAAGMWVAVSALLFGALLGSVGIGGLGDLVHAIAFTVAGWAVLAALPAVAALWLRPSHPVASGVVASLVGAVTLGLVGPQANGSGAATALALGGFLLLVCAVPAPGRTAADRFTV